MLSRGEDTDTARLLILRDGARCAAVLPAGACDHDSLHSSLRDRIEQTQARIKLDPTAGQRIVGKRFPRQVHAPVRLERGNLGEPWAVARQVGGGRLHAVAARHAIRVTRQAQHLVAAQQRKDAAADEAGRPAK